MSAKPGTKENPIEIDDPSEARGNWSYVVRPKRKEQTDGEAVPRRRSPDTRES